MTNTFLAHVMQPVGGPHRAKIIEHHVVLTSQCPACATAFRRRSIAVAHFCAERRKRAGAQQTEARMNSQRNLYRACSASAMRSSVAETVTRFVEYNRHIVQYDLPIGTQERQVRLCSGTPKPEASGSGAAPGAVQGSPRRKGVRGRVGRLGSIEEIWSNAVKRLRKKAREVAARARGANEGRSSTVQ